MMKVVPSKISQLLQQKEAPFNQEIPISSQVLALLVDIRSKFKLRYIIWSSFFYYFLGVNYIFLLDRFWTDNWWWFGNDQGLIPDLPGLPAGVKFDPTDQEIIEHLKAKVGCDTNELHPLIDEFIPTIEGETGICYTHPEKLPGNLQNIYIYFFNSK